MSGSSLLSQFQFTDRQKQAITRRSPAIAVTAGAGSGKTRVLVGRYLHLLEKGYPLRSLAAITFTDKAAREMRARIRATIEERLTESPIPNPQSPISNLQSFDSAQDKPPTSSTWQPAFTQLDAARIGTIHSLCAEILRAHPAEADIDPNFVVLEEGQAAALQSQSIDRALAWAAAQPETAPLFAALTENGLRRVLGMLLARRLDVQGAWETASETGWLTRLRGWLDARLSASAWVAALDALSQLRARTPDDKLERARIAVLDHWSAIRAAHADGDWDALFARLAQLRAAISTGGQKANWSEGDLASARQAMSVLRDDYDAELAPFVGKDGAIRWSLDRQAAALLPPLGRAFDAALDAYQRLKDERQALDFDDLEGRTARLLVERADVRARWQAELRAVLVDEFQDTNERQRRIVYALTGFGADQSADLFVVGDAKQSIYRFRGADVAVFRQVLSDIGAAGGRAVDLDLTFRAHRSLVAVTNALLAAVLGEEDDPNRPYQVPFAPLRAHRRSPASEALGAPFVEFHLGLGDDAESGRRAAAEALVERLHGLHANEGVEWSDIALLFRSSTHFDVYEDALERGGIPFVTVAGRGFYDRPEIRDVLNALAAIADLADDLALAGLLRSPALGLSDADLYRLRFAGGDRRHPLWEALMETSEVSQDFGSLTHARAHHIIAELHGLSGRVSAAEVIKRFFDLTGYRAMLSAVPEGNRLRRNVDKLLADAHRSRLVGLGEFLEYVQTLRDVGAREGEAPVEAAGAAQLMTVHKAKGLEFPIVVIADAAYEHRGGSETLLLDEHLGPVIGLTGDDGARPAMWRLASLDEAARDEAEDRRLLYVAATRAKEKLIVSGHVKRVSQGRLGLRGWLARFGDVTGLDEVVVEGEISGPQALDVRCPDDAGPIACALYPSRETQAAPISHLSSPETQLDPASISNLASPVSIAAPEHPQSPIRDPQSRVWRIVSRTSRASGPAWVVGKLAHAALRRWRFPRQGDFDVFLWPFALEAGLVDAAEIQATIDEARRLLDHFQAHPLCAEIEAAERYHEVPYTLPGDTGVIDLLYRVEDGWMIVDFKTDELRSEAEMQETIHREGYDAQVRRYVEAVREQVGERPRALLVFLRVAGEVRVVEL